jgi:CHAD domain-containing protein
MVGKLEIEIKYEVPADFSLPELTRLRGVAQVGAVRKHRLDATYFDTERLRLTGNGLTLRRRTGGGDAGWHLKRPSGADRTETQAPLTGARQGPPKSITDEVRALIRAEPLRPIAHIRTRRVELPLCGADGSVLALLADDQVDSEALIGQRARQQWRELEIELVDGDRALLKAVDEALRAAGARPASSSSKLAQSLATDYPDAGVTVPGRGAAGRALGSYLAAQRDAIIEHDPGVRAGEPRAVHQMRVATRRLRATLRSYAPLLAGDGDRLHDELAWLTRALGAVRDCDVLQARLRDAIQAEPAQLLMGPVAARITDEFAAQAAEGRQQLIAVLDSDRYLALLDAVDAFIGAQAEQPVTRRRLRRRARKALRRADSRFELAERAGSNPAGQLDGAPGKDELLHESRKAYKRARYAVELLRPLDGKRANRLADQVSELQDALGEHQDAVVAQQLLHDYGVRAQLAGESAFSYGLLHARQHQVGQEGLRPVPGLRRRIGRRKARGWLD